MLQSEMLSPRIRFRVSSIKEHENIKLRIINAMKIMIKSTIFLTNLICIYKKKGSK